MSSEYDCVMKRLQKRSKSKRRVMLAAAGAVDRVQFVTDGDDGAVPYHKTRPLSGRRPVAPAPRPDKTICDSPSAGIYPNAIDLLMAGFRRGMVSRQIRRGWPRKVRAVESDEVRAQADAVHDERARAAGWRCPV